MSPAKSDGNFAGKVAFATGAGAGAGSSIGRATALEFAREGAAVVAADLTSSTMPTPQTQSKRSAPAPQPPAVPHAAYTTTPISESREKKIPSGMYQPPRRSRSGR